MSASSFNWGAFAHLQASAADIDATDVNDEATLTSDEVSLDGVAACEVAVEAIEDNTGACDGDLYVYLLRHSVDTNFETISDDPDLVLTLDMLQNNTRRGTFSVDPSKTGSFKVLVDNDCGQQVTVTIQARTATFDTA